MEIKPKLTLKIFSLENAETGEILHSYKWLPKINGGCVNWFLFMLMTFLNEVVFSLTGSCVPAAVVVKDKSSWLTELKAVGKVIDYLGSSNICHCYRNLKKWHSSPFFSLFCYSYKLAQSALTQRFPLLCVFTALNGVPIPVEAPERIRGKKKIFPPFKYMF